MGFEMTKELVAFKKMIKAFVDTEVRPFAHDIDEEEKFPVDIVKKMGEVGLFKIVLPKEYGGADAGYPMYALAVSEIAKACGTCSVILSAHVSLCMTPIMENGTDAQKQKYLPKLGTGEWIGAFALTEPSAGSDASSQQTFAVKDGDSYVLNGSKIFITNSRYAHVYIVFAMTDKAAGLKGISAFIVEDGTPGFTIGKEEMKMGIRGSSTCELIFENCRIPKENLLGEEGKGFNLAMRTLDGGRIGIAAQALGLAQGALEETLKYVKERKQFKKPIGAFQYTQFKIADLYTRVEAARLLLEEAALAKQNHAKDLALRAAMAKLYCAETAMEVTTKCVQMFGGYGYTREYPVERLMRDAKITEIYEGTSEVQRMVIAGAVMK